MADLTKISAENQIQMLELITPAVRKTNVIQNLDNSEERSCFEDAETPNTCIAYRRHHVPEFAPPVVLYLMPHKLHLFPKRTSEAKT